MCNSLIHCPFGTTCIDGFCRNLSKLFSFDFIKISIISCSIFLLIIILILTICICLLRRQSKTTHDETPTIPITSDYDNIVYGLYRENTTDRLTCNRDDTMIYQPKIVFLGGEEQLTAIYAWESFLFLQIYWRVCACLFSIKFKIKSMALVWIDMCKDLSFFFLGN